MKSSILFFSIVVSGILAHAAPKVNYQIIKTGEFTNALLIGEEIAVQLSDFPPNSKVAVRCGKSNLHSDAVFLTDSDGRADLSKQAPLEGSYKGIDSDGMFWSRSLDPAAKPSDPSESFVCAASVNSLPLASAPLIKFSKRPDITSVRIEKSSAGFWGQYSKPAGKGPFPTILVIGGSEGGLDTYMSDYFASIGYATLAIAYYQYEDLPQQIERIPLEYFKVAIDWLKARPEAAGQKLSVVGTSRGGELALLLGSHYSEVNSVVALVPSMFVWAGGWDPVKQQQTSSWTLANEDVPFLKFLNIPTKTIQLPDGKTVSDVTSFYRESFAAAKASEVSAARIPIQNTQGPVLLLGGDQDMIWPSCDSVRDAEKLLKASDRRFIDHAECFADAGHSIGIPGYSTMDLTFLHPVFKEWMTLGGTSAGTAHAQRKGWNAVLNFLTLNSKAP